MSLGLPRQQSHLPGIPLLSPHYPRLSVPCPKHRLGELPQAARAQELQLPVPKKKFPKLLPGVMVTNWSVQLLFYHSGFWEKRPYGYRPPRSLFPKELAFRLRDKQYAS